MQQCGEWLYRIGRGSQTQKRSGITPVVAILAALFPYVGCYPNDPQKYARRRYTECQKAEEEGGWQDVQYHEEGQGGAGQNQEECDYHVTVNHLVYSLPALFKLRCFSSCV